MTPLSENNSSSGQESIQYHPPAFTFNNMGAARSTREQETTNHSSSRNHILAPLDDEEAQQTFEILASKSMQERTSRTTSNEIKKEEIRMLEYAVNKYLRLAKKTEDQLNSKDWKHIALLVPGKTETQCKYRWNMTKKKKPIKKHSWNAQEDHILTILVLRYGAKKWMKIAEEFNKQVSEERRRTNKQ